MGATSAKWQNRRFLLYAPQRTAKVTMTPEERALVAVRGFGGEFPVHLPAHISETGHVPLDARNSFPFPTSSLTHGGTVGGQESTSRSAVSFPGRVSPGFPRRCRMQSEAPFAATPCRPRSLQRGGEWLRGQPAEGIRGTRVPLTGSWDPPGSPPPAPEHVSPVSSRTVRLPRSRTPPP